MKLVAKRLGLAGGVLWGACMFIFTILSVITGYGDYWLMVMSSAYPGYEITLAGSIVGAIYGFVDGFVGLYLLAWLYNKFSNVK